MPRKGEVCMICGEFKRKLTTRHVFDFHDMTLKAYRARYGRNAIRIGLTNSEPLADSLKRYSLGHIDDIPLTT